MEPCARRGKARKPLVEGEFLGSVRFPGGGRGKRSVRQRRSVMDDRFSGFGSPRHLPQRVPRHVWSGFRFLLQKELRNSDVGSLGRMVLPKCSIYKRLLDPIGFQKEAEAHLPVLTAREGIFMSMDDMETLQVWTFKYRFWPNNRSRMYVLENTGEFVKTHGLRLGDFIMLYKDDERHRFIIRARKAHAEEPSSPVIETHVTEIREDPKHCEDIPGPMIYSDAYLPMQDDISMGMAFDTNGDAFLTDFTVEFTEEMLGSMTSLRSVPSLDSLENLSLDDF